MTCAAAADPAARERAILLLVGLAAVVASGIAPFDRVTWMLEVAPVVVAVPVLVLTARRFPLTTLTCRLILLHAIVLAVGGHYTYALVPLGEWMRDAFGFARNHFDRIGHFLQGFVPAIIAREVMLRRGVVRGRGWLFFLVTCTCLAISAAYEIFEWLAAVIGGSAADAFLGTQGDPWDTQWDMALAGCGATIAQLVLARPLDAAIRGLPPQGALA